jgi:hypothetical protein
MKKELEAAMDKLRKESDGKYIDIEITYKDGTNFNSGITYHAYHEDWAYDSCRHATAMEAVDHLLSMKHLPCEPITNEEVE